MSELSPVTGGPLPKKKQNPTPWQWRWFSGVSSAQRFVDNRSYAYWTPRVFPQKERVPLRAGVCELHRHRRHVPVELVKYLFWGNIQEREERDAVWHPRQTQSRDVNTWKPFTLRRSLMLCCDEYYIELCCIQVTVLILNYLHELSQKNCHGYWIVSSQWQHKEWTEREWRQSFGCCHVACTASSAKTWIIGGAEAGQMMPGGSNKPSVTPFTSQSSGHAVNCA